ncbi:MAG TPA: divalent metal cation transporter, partial [Reyranella sp.]|nr:divalent metal cation transporter [Reyranella sp.]
MDARSPDLTQDAAGWRTDAPATKSLAEVNATIAVPTAGVWWRRLLAFVGPGY